MTEDKHFDLRPIFPGKHIYTQIAAYSERFPSLRFEDGSEVNYHRVNLESAPREVRAGIGRSLAELIYRELEVPSFLPQSPEMPYDVLAFEELVQIPESVVLLAWRRDKLSTSPQLVGYLIGSPYKNYPKDMQEDFLDDATLGGARRNVAVPDDTTWMFDTFAVRESQRGSRIGTTLLELMLQQMVYPGSPYDKLATFAVDHSTSYTRDMVLRHRWLKDQLIVDELGPYRGITGHYMMFDLGKNYK